MRLRSFVRIAGVCFMVWMPVLVDGVNILCENCGRPFNVKSLFEAMNRCFCSEKCATVLGDQIENGIEPRYSLLAKRAKIRKNSITNPSLQQMIDFLQQSEQVGHLVPANKKEVFSRKSLNFD